MTGCLLTYCPPPLPASLSVLLARLLACSMLSNAWGTADVQGEDRFGVFGAAVAVVDATLSYAFGGVTTGGANTNQLIAVAQAGITAISTNGTAPSARRFASAVYLANCYGTNAPCLVVFGGTTGSNFLADLYVLDMRSVPFRWSAVSAVGTLPVGRHSASAVASTDGTQAYFFGGVTSVGAVNDIFVLAPGGFSDPADNEVVNIALNKPAAQSSMQSGGFPQRAVDGITTTNYNSNSAFVNNATQTTYNLCSHTTLQADPWWRVNLGSVQQFNSIKIYDRTDCCAGRIAGFQVYVSNVDDYNTARASGPCVNPFSDITDASAEIDLTLTPGGRCASGQYVWISLPGITQYLTICEAQVRQKVPFVWRQLGGAALKEVAQGKKAEQSSTELCCAGGDASRAIDGDTSNNDYNRGSCSHTLTNRDQPNNAPWWLVDLGNTFDVQRIQVWPRTDCCTGNRNKNWRISVGLSRDEAYDVRVPGVPADLAATSSFTFNLASPTRSRYAIVSRPYLAGDDNILQICEFKVWASLLLDQPSPRSATAFAAFRGFLMVFGGADANGFKLNDLRLFDTINKQWLPYTAPLNTPPTQRSSAAMLVLSSSRVALFGGASATDTLADVFYYDASACPVLDRTGWTNLRTSHSGSFDMFDCLPGYTHTNGGKPLICDPTTGVWRGLYHFPTRSVCIAQGPQAPTIISVTPITPTSARVVWSPPSVMTGVAFYVVEAAPDATFIERFTSANGPSDLLTAWFWDDPKTTSSYRFTQGMVRIDAAISSDCSVATPRGCPVLSRAWPAGVAADDFSYEAWVAFDSNVVQNTQFAGIGLVQDNSAQGLNNTLVFHAGLYRSATAFQGYYGTGTSSVFQAVSFTKPIYGSWIKIERIRPTVPGGPATYRAAYRFALKDSWFYLPSSISDSQLNGGPLDVTRLRLAVLLRNANTASRASAIVDDIRISSRSCTAPGQVRTISNAVTNAIVDGLVPGQGYRFQVSSSSNTVMGATSARSALITMATAAPTPVPPMTGNIALNKPSQMTGSWSTTQYFAPQCNDGIVNTVSGRV